VLAHRCRLEDGSVLVLHNLSDGEQVVEIGLPHGRQARDLLSHDEPVVGDGELRVVLEPYGYRWFREEPGHDAGEER
jgi:hypothetical protein